MRQINICICMCHAKKKVYICCKGSNSELELQAKSHMELPVGKGLHHQSVCRCVKVVCVALSGLDYEMGIFGIPIGVLKNFKFI